MTAHHFANRKRQLADNGEPPENGGIMELRVAQLEAFAEKTCERLGSIEKDLNIMVSNYATKSDVANISVALHKELNQQTWILVKELNAQTWKLIGWTTGLGASMVGFTFWLARAIH